jgi:UDP:flavonoid glycosyltransferase YjiC (YdhE family)
MKFILVPIGSAGDMHPFIWLGKLLKARGHEVVVIAQAMVSDMPERAGLRTKVLGDKEAQRQVLSDERLWHPRKAVGLLLESIPLWARETMAAIEEERIPGETVMLAGALAVGARVLAERFGVPLITVHLQPSVFMSVEESPVIMAGGEWVPRVPRWVRRAFFGLVDFQVDRAMKGPVNAIRREAGIAGKAISGVMRHYWHSPDGVLCLFPEWYARKATDWPAQAVTTRFPLYDEAGDRGGGEEGMIDPALEDFLAEGGKEEKPVVVTAGSANLQAARFFQESCDALRSLNRRGILLTRFPEQLPATLPLGVHSSEYVPFSQVFPRAAAVIHHGGIGTTAQCFAAGVPQLIMPMAHDQPDNATRIKRLGVGDYLYPKAFHAPAIAKKLTMLLGSVPVANQCAIVREKMQRQISPGEVAQLIETLVDRRIACLC